MPRKIQTKEELAANIEKARTEIRQGEHLVGQLRREISKEERNLRTSRLIQRGAIAENLIPGATSFTNEQFQTILSAALNTGAAREVIAFFKKSNSAATAGAMPSAE